MGMLMYSTAAAMALRRIATRTGLSRPSAVLAAVCALLAWRTGYQRLVFPTLASNRFERDLVDYVGTLTQSSLATVEVADATFDELVRRAWLAVLRAGKHGRYDVARRREIARAVEDRRGVRFGYEPLFNSTAIEGPGNAHEPEPTLEAMERARSATTMRRIAMRETPTLLRFDLFQFEERVRLSFWTGDTARVPIETAESSLRALEGLLMAAAATDLDFAEIGKVLGLEPINYGPDWLRVDSHRVELAEVRRLVVDALAPTPVEVFREVAGQPLVAYLVATGEVRTPADAHARCLAALPGRHTAMTPTHYVLCETAPSDPTNPASWATVRCQGSGRLASGTNPS